MYIIEIYHFHKTTPEAWNYIDILVYGKYAFKHIIEGNTLRCHNINITD